jgi:hypothetical protein
MSSSLLLKDPPQAGVERRKWPRFPVRGLCASVVRESDKAFWAAEPQDLSRSGIRLVAQARIETGTQAEVVVYRDDECILFQVSMQVVYVVAQPGNRWVIGGAFTRELSEDEMQGALWAGA